MLIQIRKAFEMLERFPPHDRISVTRVMRTRSGINSLIDKGGEKMYRVGGSTGVFGCRCPAKASSLTGQQKCHIHRMENVTLNPKEQARLQVLNSLLAEHMTLDQAATLMGVTPRHTRRILAAYREEGAAAVAHGHRGRRPANATPDAVVASVVRLARTRYEGANHTHLSELLSERDGINIGRTTLRRILLDAGLTSPRRRRPPKHRVRRERMPREGMLIQMDGSHHPWLGDQAPPFALWAGTTEPSKARCRI